MSLKDIPRSSLGLGVLIDSKAVARTRTGKPPAGFQVSSATRRKGTSRDELQVGIFFEYSIGPSLL